MGTNPHSMRLPFERNSLDRSNGERRYSTPGTHLGMDVVGTFKRNCMLEHENRELRDAVRKLSRLVDVDRLTGLANRRYFDAALFGGEEFALLLPCIESTDTNPVVDRLRRRVAATPPARENGTKRCQPVTISVGMTTLFAASAASPSKVILAADIALYKAKRAGRNRIMYHPITDMHKSRPGTNTSAT